MRNENTFGDKVSNWRVVNTNLEPHLPEMPHLRPLHAEMGGLITEAEAHDAEHETARGRLRELSARKRDIERRGQTLRSRLAAHLKGTFGYTSKQLVQFGLNPLKTTGRKRKQPAEPPAPPPTAAQ